MDTYCFELQIAPTLLLFFTVYKLPQHISSLSSVLYLNMLIAWLQTQVTGTVPNVSVLDGSHWLSLYNFVTDRLENTTFNSSSTVMHIFTATALWWTFSKKIYIICYYAFISDEWSELIKSIYCSTKPDLVSRGRKFCISLI